MLINTDLLYSIPLIYFLMHMVLIVNQPRFKLQNTLGGIFQELSYSDHLKRGLREYENVCLSETIFDPCA